MLSNHNLKYNPLNSTKKKLSYLPFRSEHGTEEIPATCIS